MKTCLFIISAAIIVCASLLNAQPKYVYAGKFSVGEGLSQSYCSAILQDRMGFMWFGTKDGLNRYDGYKFDIYQHIPGDSVSLSNNYITSLCRGSGFKLWIGTDDGGLDLYNPVNNSFKIFRHIFNDPGCLPSNSINTIVKQRDGAVLIGTNNGGACEFIGKDRSFKNIPFSGGAGKNVHEICEDRKGRLWFLTTDSLFCFDPARKESLKFFRTIKNHFGPGGSLILTLNTGQSGRLWAGTKNGLDTLDFKNMSWVKVKTKYKDNEVKDVRMIIKIGRWLGLLAGSTFGVVDPATGKFYPEYTSSDLKKAYVDKTGILWLNTSERGVIKMNPESRFFKSYKGRFEVKLLRTSLLKVSRALHIPFGDFSRYNNSYLSCRGGNIWLNLAHYGIILFKKDIGSVRLFRHTKPGTEKKLIYEDRSGKVWFVRRMKMMTYDYRTNKFKYIPIVIGPAIRSLYPNGSPYRGITCMYQDSIGEYWLGTPTMGLLRWYGNDRPVESFHHIRSDTNSISSNFVLSITEDPRNPDNILWIGTNGGGLDRFNKTTGRFRKYDLKNGLPNDVVYGILTDRKGNLWLSTNNGISRFNPSTGKFINFSVKDGLQGNEFNMDEYYEDSTGMMYFGGTNGYNAFRPERIKSNPNPPVPYITGLRLFNKAVDIKYKNSPLYKSLLETKTLRLDYKQNLLTFEFVGLEYTAPSKNRYKYKLAGFNKNWIYAGTRRTATYTNLDPGTYRFLVKAANSSGVWSTKEAELTVIITPPFWITWWFRVLAVLILFAAVGGMIRYIELGKFKKRMRELEHQADLERERLRISRDIHDDLGSSLTRVTLLSDLAGNDSQDPEKTRETLNDIADTTRSIAESLDEIVWAVNPHYDSLVNMMDYLAQFAAGYLEQAGIECHLDLPEINTGVSVSSELRHNVYMVLRETLNNAVKYSGAKNIWITFKHGDNEFKLELRDDGSGFELNKIAPFSEGLQNMKQRMNEIGGTFDITTSPGKGTAVSIKVPAG